MSKYEYSTLSPHIYNPKILYLLLIIAIIYILYVYYNQYYNSVDNLEGFSQIEKFVVKRDNQVYDDFYSDIYDKIHKPQVFTPYIMKMIINNTQVSDKSVFLDVGCGTGHLLNEINELGYHAYGIDKSKSMVEYCSQKYPDMIVKEGSIEDPMSFDNKTFSHILCLYYTIYHMKNKDLFFKNSYQWLQPGGYLIIHLVDTKKFDTSVPASWSPLFNRYQSNGGQITNSIVDFNEFTYKQVYKPTPQKKEAVITETFTDLQTKNVRQNEQTWYMDSIEEIVRFARRNGFIPHGEIKMNELNEDENQFIYIFERGL